MRSLPAFFLFACVGAVACATYAEPRCQVGADCPSGICNGDGTCAPAPASTGSSSSAGGASSASSSSAGGGAAGAGGSPACLPNDDGTITRQEVPLAAGQHATYLVADGATYATAGTAQPDGSRVWDLTVSFSGDHDLVIDTQAIDPGAWYAAAFPGATYAAQLSDLAANAGLLGIFELTGSALLLLGVASSMDGPSATELIYATPIVVLAFPLTQGKTWVTLSAVTGKVQGIPIGGIYNEQYTSTVDMHGTLKTPYADFPVLRVQTSLLRFLNGLTTTKYTDTFVTECFGTVGTIVSQDDEPSAEFTSTAELWRLAK